MKKYLIIFLYFLVACGSDQTRVSIVDKDGNPAKINKMTPKFNRDQLEKQREAIDRNQNSEVRRTELNKFKQVNQTQNIDDENFITNSNTTSVDINESYPDDIFADRITNYNYNYTQEMQNQSPVRENRIVEVATTKQNATPKTQPKPTTQDKGFYIQLGIYSEKKNAQKIYDKFKKIHSGSILNYNNNKNKVVLGPYSNKTIAEKDMNKIIKQGHYDVYIIEQK
ncbi:MAG: hypothetical protein Ta2D_06590 [Rickettsiales bacterium]|nr:MAG: hypothetical protein Ta2D_06590 [Rickettsiales bacterium]